MSILYGYKKINNNIYIYINIYIKLTEYDGITLNILEINTLNRKC